MRINLILTFVFIVTVAPLHGQEDWTLKKDQDGIVIYTRSREDNPLKEYRASADIQATLETVFSFSTDVSLHPQWVFRCKDLTIIEEESGKHILYHTSYDIPWPMADRDLVVRAVITWEADSSKVRILTSKDNHDYQVQEDVIRMPEYLEDVVLERTGRGTTLFKVEGFADPGGTIPAWLTNMFLVDGIYDSVVKTREWVVKE